MAVGFQKAAQWMLHYRRILPSCRKLFVEVEIYGLLRHLTTPRQNNIYVTCINNSMTKSTQQLN